MAKNYQVIIVGLGAAGASAAATLAKAGKRVLALEAQGRVGGRVHTVKLGEGVVELGAEWVHGSSPSPVYDAAKRHNIILVPQNLDQIVFKSNGDKPDRQYQELFNGLVEQLFAVTDKPSDNPEPLGDYATKKLMSYITKEIPQIKDDKEFIEQVLDYTNMLVNNYNASNDWNDVNSQSNYTPLEGHQHLSWHKYGYKTLFDILLNKDVGYPTLDVKLNSEVIEIDWSDVRVMVTCKNGEVYTAEQVIVTVSLGVLKDRHETMFKPKLPPNKQRAIKKMAMGIMDKIDLVFKEVWWPLDAAFFGFIWREEDKQQIPKRDLWMTKVFAASRPLGSQNVLTLWTSGDVAKLVEKLPLQEVKTKCKEILVRFMGKRFNVTDPVDIMRTDWFSNPYTKGSYSFDSLRTARYPAARQHLAQPLLDSNGRPKVLFAGEATHETHFSTVHGATESGIREAARVLQCYNSNSKL